MGSLSPNALVPIASTLTSPRRLTSVTMPGTTPRSTWPDITSCMRSSRAPDNPPVLIACCPSLGLWHRRVEERRDYRKQQIGAVHKRHVRDAGEHRQL